ncbi:MAG: nucleotidyltransferase [Candidatus Viridilinea halotolerans]|uniref:Nucleotidyltransferase n=1 Tax=Candidatus Viridilinea halotolerans TaxID=2491704 RepID=A0A426TT38_9CHLR|nr:MAG: nucleotidyltransferase [Candidatus Viridilinea halotolerans]
MLQANLVINYEQIEAFCRRHHIRRLALFGSVLREDFGSDSDIDILVDFDPNHIPGLALIRMQDELSALLGGKAVDLVTPKFLNQRIRAQVLAEAKEIYVQR